MVQRFFAFLVVHLLLLNGEFFAQTDSAQTPTFSNGSVSFDRDRQNVYGLPFTTSGYNFHNREKFSKIFFNQSKINLIPEAFYYNNLSFFCRKELDFQRKTSIPFRFRLGSLQYVNYLEGKSY